MNHHSLASAPRDEIRSAPGNLSVPIHAVKRAWRLAFGAGCFCLLVWNGSSAWAAEAEAGAGRSLARIQSALDRGQIGESEAARQRLYFLFDRSRMDPRWRAEGEPPAKCGTVLLAQLGRQLDRLDADAQALYRRYTGSAELAAATNSYNTLHFHIEWESTGPDAPIPDDVAPANGVPDFVERTAEACEHSWAVEVDQLGYRAPALGNPGQRYTVSYQAQSSYGYTVLISGQSTRIVLNPNYQGFPFNDDPDGDVLGALRVTVAHELKHAIQRMYSNWIEDSWLELDATWIEDLVYDDVNDYVNFVRLPTSPFTAPQTPLNAGGAGSYDDCNWEHFQSQKFGADFLRQFWERRAVNSEPVMSTYRAIFEARGVSLEDAWGEYVAWNFASGSRAAAGFGYEEASSYPTPPAGTLHTALPVTTTSWGVQHLAAGVHLIENPDAALSGMPEFTFSTGSTQIPWRVSVLLGRRSGTVSWVPVEVNNGAATVDLAGEDWANLAWAALLVGNPLEGGPPFLYTFSARTVAPIQIVHDRLWDVASGQPYPVTARVTPGTSTVLPGSVSVLYRVGGGTLQPLPMSPTGNPDEYSAQIPGQPQGAGVEYAIEAQSVTGVTVRAPATPSAFYPFQVVSLFEPFETDGDWTVGEPSDDATGGVWERAVPRGTVSAPYVDSTLPPGAACFLTQNGAPGSGDADTDVDGGKTTLLSPVFTFPAGHPYGQAIARYHRWYSNDVGARPDDVWRVDASNDGGATWTNVETATLGANTWVPVTVDLIATFGQPDRVRFRFVAQDAGQASLVEAAVDDFELLATLVDPVGVGEGRWAGPRLSAPSPNPSRGAVTAELTLPRAAQGRAEIHDLQGRLVRRLLAASPLPAGSSQLKWDGRDEGGRHVAAGLYVITVETMGRTLQTRAMVLR